MHRGKLNLALLAVCGALLANAQGVSTRHAGPRQAPPATHKPAQTPSPNTTPAAAVYFDATKMGSPVVLNKDWRVGITANPAAADPGFDDSHWAVRNATGEIADVPDDDESPQPAGAKTQPQTRDKTSGKYVWFRLHVKLPASHGPLALLIELPISVSSTIGVGSSATSLDVFANGRLIQPGGPHGDDPSNYQSISRLYTLNVPSDQTDLVIVLRSIYIPVGTQAYTGFFADRTLHLGAPDDLNHSLELWSLHGILERLPRAIVSILQIVLAIFLLALYFNQRGHLEYMWLALHELAQAPIGFIDLAGSTAHIPEVWFGALFLQLIVVSAYSYFEFLVYFLDLPQRWAGMKKRRLIQLGRFTAPILLGVGPILLLVVHTRSTPIAVLMAVIYLGSMLWLLGWVLFCFITLIAATVRRNFEAGLLLFPLILSFIGILEPVFTSSMKAWSGHPYFSPLTIQAGPVPIHFASIADFAGMLAIVLIIFVRFLRIHRDRERASSELAAARSVQELMIPQERMKTPGFEVDSIYNPAAEVGGDFFHVDSTGDGGLLVVIGDVAGKGLRAAMNVSMLMGALRRMQEKSPAKILESLNRVLHGGESFTTCQAAWFGANGELVLANAGHLPPYLNTQEVFVPGGLPLGVLPEVRYDEVRLYLHPGDRLLLLSDGVVEARHTSGELFGFDRVHNLSNQSAFYIADAAKAFGQEDDITVLTVRRLAQAVAA
ncbi:MAG: PP2C family protein-serine/threonine phosphatase [Acidobacteriota bacterium]